MPEFNRILLAEVKARVGCEEAVMTLLAQYGRHVRAEPGNRVFACHQVEDAPQRFFVYEVYSDEAAFQAHLSAPENAEVNACLVPLTEAGSSLTFLRHFE